ncbi:MAG TPA: hypothetical protein PLT30_14790 [Deltaproteobacteria bacterium]|mgnify:CR=1 FL=1|nr:hypothetical protein [Deltaproteobacteria bacterium]
MKEYSVSVNDAKQDYLDTMTMYCSRLRCRMTPEQCAFNQDLPPVMKKIPMHALVRMKRKNIKLWRAVMNGRRQPPQCSKCPGINGDKPTKKRRVLISLAELRDEMV